MAQKTVWFYSLHVTDEYGVTFGAPTDFWQKLSDAYPPNDGSEVRSHRETLANKTVIEGRFHFEDDVFELLYLGRSRDRLDWPDKRDEGQMEIVSIASDQSVAEVLEPCRVMPVSGRPIVAVARSFAAAQHSAIEEWLTAAYQKVKQGTTVTLTAYAREDQLERLNRALGASQLEVVIAAPRALDLAGAHGTNDPVGNAVHSLQEELGAAARIRMSVSVGNIKNQTTLAGMKEAVIGLLNKGGYESLGAKLVEVDDATHELKKSAVDFIEDQVSYTIQVNADEVTEAAYPRLLRTAIAEFRKDTKL